MSKPGSDQNSVMRKAMLEKPDGRYLIYYRFQKPVEAKSPLEKSPCKPGGDKQTTVQLSALISTQAVSN